MSNRLEIELGADNSELKKVLEDSKKEIAKFKGEIEKKGNVINFKADIDAERKAIESATASAKAYNAELAKRKNSGGNSASTNQSKSESDGVKQLEGAYKALTSQIKDQRTIVRDLGAELQNLKSSNSSASSAVTDLTDRLSAEKATLIGLESSLKSVNDATNVNKNQLNLAKGSYAEAQQRLSALGLEIRNTTNGFTKMTPELKNKVNQYNTLNDALKRFDATMGNHQRNVGNYGSAMAGALPYIQNFTSLAGAMGIAVEGVKKSFNTNLKFDAMNYALKFTSGSAYEFNENMRFLANTSDRLGLDLLTTSQAFKKWQGAAKYSNFTADQTRTIFESVANASSKMKLSTDEVNGTFLALSQMMSKGKVQAEELRGQLGERLPGAFALAAKAMGVTEQELNKMLETGQVIASDFLPKFAKQLDESFSNDKTERIKSMQAETNRLSTSFDNLFKSKNATNFFSVVLEGLKGFTDGLNDFISTDGFLGFTNFIKSISNPSMMLGDIVGKGFGSKLSDWLDLDSYKDFAPSMNRDKGTGALSNGRLAGLVDKSAFVGLDNKFGFSGSKYSPVATKELKEEKKEIIQNKAYWDDRAKALKANLEAMADNQRGSKEWLATLKDLKFAEAKSDLYDYNKKPKKGARDRQPDFLKSANDAVAELTAKEGRGLEAEFQKIDVKYQKVYDKVNKIANESEKARLTAILDQNKALEKQLFIYENPDFAFDTKKGLGSGIKSVMNADSIVLPKELKIPVKYELDRTKKAKIDGIDLSKQVESSFRRSLSGMFDGIISDFSIMRGETASINKKYEELKAKADGDSLIRLSKMQALEKKISNGFLSLFDNLVSRFSQMGGNLLTSAVSKGISSGDFNDLSTLFKGNKKALGYGALASMAGGLIQGNTKKTSTLGQGLGGALAGAGTGAMIGSVVPGIGTAIGAVAGGIIGALGGIFGASKAKKQEELEKLQLEEQKKQTAIMQRQEALAYNSNIYGQMTNQGVVTGVDRDAFGNLTATISGRDIILSMQRTESGR